MQYFDIYNYLLGLMNRRIQCYSVLGVSKETGIDDDDVESASLILEEQGIVNSYGERSFAFVGGIELMREFLVDGKNEGLSAKFEVNTEGIALENITDMKWSLVKKEETRATRESGSRRRRNMFDSLFGVDDDDDDDDRLNLIERSRKQKEESKVRLCRIVTSFIENKEGYDPISRSFSPHIRISYPDGTPFVFQYMIKDESHYFTDNGLMKKYLTEVAKNLPRDIIESWVEYELNLLAKDSSLTYEDGVMYSNVEGSYDEEDLNGEISYFIKVVENFFTEFYKKYKTRELNEMEEFIIKGAVNTFLLNTYSTDLTFQNESLDNVALDLLTKIVLINENVGKSHAINIAENLINISNEENGNKNRIVFEKLLELINTISELEFKILQKAVECVLR